MDIRSNRCLWVCQFEWDMNYYKKQKDLYSRLISFCMSIKSLKGETICPFSFVQIEQHFLFQLILSIIDGNWIIMSVQSMNQGLYWRWVSICYKKLRGNAYHFSPMNHTWIDGLFKWPRFDVVWRGSCPSIIVWGLIRRKASMTTFPFTLWMGSTTTATALWFNASKL